jgi:uncharacterized repeat protein (TIGR01451 family)
VNVTGPGPLLIGGYSASNSLPSGGLLDEFRLYDRALFATEVAATWDQEFHQALAKSVSPSAAEPGEAITYTLSFTNTESITVTEVVIIDTLPTESGNPHIDSSGVPVTPVPGSLTLVVTDTTEAASSPDDVVISVGMFADLTIAKTVELDHLTGITYTLVASNLGPNAADGAVISDTLPSNVYSAMWTSSGASGTVGTASGAGNIHDTLTSFPAGGVITYTIHGSLASWDYVANTAQIISPSGIDDPQPDNNWATVQRFLLDLSLVFNGWSGL